MKKIIILITAFSFFVSILGVNATVGYCPMKKNYSISFFKKAYSCCCTKSNKKKCCNSQKIEIKKITDHYLSSVVKSIPLENSFALNQHRVSVPKQVIIGNLAIKENYKPPGDPVSLIILYRSILI